MADTDTVRVVVGWDDENESTWVAKAYSPDEQDESSERFVSDIPAALWDRVESASADLNEAITAAAEATGYDAEAARMSVCCDEWRGYVTPGHNWWAIVVPAAENAWPLHDHAISFENSFEQAQAKIAELPEEFSVVHMGGFSSIIHRDALRIEESAYGPTISSCYHCGWPRSDHANEGAPVGE